MALALLFINIYNINDFDFLKDEWVLGLLFAEFIMLSVMQFSGECVVWVCSQMRIYTFLARLEAFGGNGKRLLYII